MRLTKEQANIIVTTLKNYADTSTIYLHGSRLNNDKKGGDIDLFLIVEDSDYLEIKKISYKISAELSLKLNQQKVDLIIVSKSDSNHHEFFMNSEKIILK